jgi:hypothetical protein
LRHIRAVFRRQRECVLQDLFAMHFVRPRLLFAILASSEPFVEHFRLKVRKIGSMVHSDLNCTYPNPSAMASVAAGVVHD